MNDVENFLLRVKREVGSATYLTRTEALDLADDIKALQRRVIEVEAQGHARLEYLFQALDFPTRHRWGGDVHEFIQGIDIARMKKAL